MKLYRVYRTNYKDGSYYIGFSGKSDKMFEFYYGSNTTNKPILGKDVLFKSHKKSEAKFVELLYQLKGFYDPNCVNLMMNIRLRRDHIKRIPKFNINIEDNENEEIKEKK